MPSCLGHSLFLKLSARMVTSIEMRDGVWIKTRMLNLIVIDEHCVPS